MKYEKTIEELNRTNIFELADGISKKYKDKVIVIVK